MTDGKRTGGVPLYGEGGPEASSMATAADRAEGPPGKAQKPGRRVVGTTNTGEPVPEQSGREQQGVADHRPSRA